jgi:hypothetical protein
MIWLLPLLLFLLLAVLALAFYARRIEPRRVEITRYDVACPNLPPELDGLTICQLSDIHVAREERHEGCVADALRSVSADLYVLTGDLIHGERGIPRLVAWLAKLSDAVRPAVAVPGNAEHKIGVDPADVRSGLESVGVPLLVNASMRLPVRGGEVQIVGVDDPHTGFSDFEEAYRDADPALWTLLLCHSPDGVADIGDRRADLVLCGHTHGGQIRLPIVGALHAHTLRVRGLVAGWYRGEALSRAIGRDAGSMQVYISRGLGRSGVPYRLLCRPELPVFTLRRA